MADQPESATVTFNCANNNVAVNRDRIVVEHGNQLILTLDLQIQGTCSAKFPNGSRSIDFPDGGPPGYRVNRNSDTQVVLTETNGNASMQDQEYCFKVGVDSGGDRYWSPDPTLVNKGEPGG